MGLFIIACGVVVTVGLLARAQHPEGVLVVPVGAWLALLALLGVWFVWLLYLST
jgi:hypothetical protein